MRPPKNEEPDDRARLYVRMQGLIVIERCCAPRGPFLLRSNDQIDFDAVTRIQGTCVTEKTIEKSPVSRPGWSGSRDAGRSGKLQCDLSGSCFRRPFSLGIWPN